MAEAKDGDKGERILIVDDTLQNIQVLGTVLREQNYQINVAQNGMQALESVGKVPPDLILLDVMMPEMDGFEACKRLKADEDTRDIPVIFLTAKVETEDVVHGFDLGAVDYVTKPFNATELLARVHTHLELRRLRRELQEYNEQLEEKVAERTADLQRAHKQLQLQVRELEGRDRLAQAQMNASEADQVYEQVLSVLTMVLGVSQAKVYRFDEGEGQLVLKAAIGLAGEGQLQMEEDLEGEPTVSVEADDPVAGALGAGRPVANNGEALVPILYGEGALGVIWVNGLRSDDAGEEETLNVLWRLSRDVALVCHAVAQSQALESGDIDVSALLDIEE